MKDFSDRDKFTMALLDAAMAALDHAPDLYLPLRRDRDTLARMLREERGPSVEEWRALEARTVTLTERLEAATAAPAADKPDNPPSER